MKPPKTLPTLLLSCLVLSGCQTGKKAKDGSPLTPAQQESALSKTTPPQQFSAFSIHRAGNGITYSGNTRLHPHHLASVDMLKDNIPVIKVRGKSKRNRMNVLLDFGSASSWLEFSASQKFAAQVMGIDGKVIPYRGKSNTGGQNAYAGVVTQLRIEDVFMEDIPFYIRMVSGSLGPLARGIQKPKVDAVLGYDNLRAFEYIQINLRKGTISFSSDIPYIPHDELLMTTAQIINLPGYGLTIEGAIRGKPVPVVLDFAGDYSFERGDKKVNNTKQVSLGDVVFLNVPTLVLEPHKSPPRAGRRMLESYIITICAPEGVVYFERPPE